MTKYMHVSFLTKNGKSSAITYGDALLTYNGETLAEVRLRISNELKRRGDVGEDSELPTIIAMTFLKKDVYKALQGGLLR